jgi:hypothetical protein
MVDEGITQLAASAGRVAEPLGRFPCRRYMGERCRLAVWILVVGAFIVGCLTPIAAKAQAWGGAPWKVQATICAGTAANKLGACNSPQPFP